MAIPATGSGNRAIHNAGTLTITSSTISNNTSASTGAGLINTSGGSATINQSTFSSNQASLSNGGAILNSSGSTLTIANTTFSANIATSTGSQIVNGGAIYNIGTLTLSNSTLSANRAPTSGGGLYNEASATLHLHNTIIANSVSGGDCNNQGTIATNLNNLVEDGGCSASISGDPLLAPLGSYGGSTQTFALLPGSLAIDAGDGPSCSASPVNNLGQRGLSRPTGASCDIGAFESGGFTISRC